MKVLVDANVAIASRTGNCVYVRGMINSLIKIDSSTTWFTLGNGIRVDKKLFGFVEAENLKKVIVKIPNRDFPFKEFFWTQMILPSYAFWKSVDIFWQPAGHVVPVIGKYKKVITIHDLRTMHLKEDIFPQDISKIKRAVEMSDLIIAISEFTKNDLINYLGVKEDKVKVIYNGVDSIQKVDKEVADESRLKFGLDKDFLLAVGVGPRKNVERILKGFALSQLKEQFILVFVGLQLGVMERYFLLVKELGLDKKVKFLGYVNDKDLISLYSCATAFVFPSLFEGFGLPVLEAQMCGCPVITSNVSALPEVAGDSALLVDPYSVEEISNAMKMVVYDTNLRASLIEKGLLNAQRFSWERAGKELLEIFSF